MKSTIMFTSAALMLTAGVEAGPVNTGNAPGVATWRSKVASSPSWGNSKECAGGTKHFITSTKSSKTNCRDWAFNKIDADKDGDQSVTGNQDSFCVQYNENANKCKIYATHQRQGSGKSHIDAMQLDVVPKTCIFGYSLSGNGNNCNEIDIANCATQAQATCSACDTGYELLDNACTLTPIAAAGTFGENGADGADRDTIHTTDSGNDQGLHANENKKAFCAVGYHLGSEAGHQHETHITSDGSVAPTNVTKGTDDFQTCLKCPTGQTSSGGTHATCHSFSDTWTACSHMGCALENDATKACSSHASQNPKQDLSTSIAIVENTCRDFTHSVQRIKIFHHGHEESGTTHMCKLTGTRASANRQCECLCKSHNNAEQVALIAKLAEDKAVYEARADLPGARGY